MYATPVSELGLGEDCSEHRGMCEAGTICDPLQSRCCKCTMAQPKHLFATYNSNDFSSPFCSMIFFFFFFPPDQRFCLIDRERGRDCWPWAKYVWPYSDLLQALTFHSSYSSRQSKDILISVSAVPHCVKGRGVGEREK